MPVWARPWRGVRARRLATASPRPRMSHDAYSRITQDGEALRIYRCPRGQPMVDFIPYST